MGKKYYIHFHNGKECSPGYFFIADFISAEFAFKEHVFAVKYCVKLDLC